MFQDNDYKFTQTQTENKREDLSKIKNKISEYRNDRILTKKLKQINPSTIYSPLHSLI